jgi:D-alanyl-D-alanine dipeptidase
MTETLKKIRPDDLIALDDYVTTRPIAIDLVYAQENHDDNMFQTGIYRKDAKMWCHRELAPIILHAADLCWQRAKLVFELKDCLRTVEAQEAMRDSDIVRANPQWLEGPARLLSPPGAGGHPRGMAVDIILVDVDGEEVDMGTPFDFLTTDRENNPAARDYKNLSADILKHRKLLEDCMRDAAKAAGRELLPLPQEWWDFRFPYSYSNQFEPIRDANLPPDMRMTALK